MLRDIVIDANVFLHAENEVEIRREACLQLISLLWKSQTSLCVDEGFSVVEASNRSQINAEYLTHLRFGTLGYALIAHLAQSSRVRSLPRKVPSNVANQINRQVTKGPDRVYVRVAYNSEERTLASHDFGDIPQAVRDRLNDSLGVEILAALDVLAKMAPDEGNSL